ncbi:MXAN_6577-like cysteine-rich protein [Sorangium atrum]|uniref:MXAN_6577-like cysteine-rich protein n=1 Tax=Sorangium atrum TaxID=2995308 RepID=A0ABT5C2E1_9BACT|nr:MXAN_6577-like cysteine-rich protein [Sorangium aterium]MDC0680585.1 MXAN_6577-like cysteine-rich protein [Sorangium aterium]
MNRSGLRPRSALSSAALLLAAGVVLAASCAESPEASGECADGLSRCNGECVELQANAEHCGACGDACEEGQRCVEGRCGEGGGGEGGGDIGSGVGGGEGCREGQTDCSGRCVNVEIDPRNCGDCDVACAEGRVCADGSCACAGDLTECDGACVDVRSDRLNCGECGSSCAPAQQCVDGACTCPDGLADCGGSCADLQTSPFHCGDCGVACERGALCQAGACTCVLGTYDELSDTFPQTVTGTTISGETNYDLACVAAGSSERVYRFTPSEAGTYTLDTVGSAFDTAIGVLGATTCAQLACNDDLAPGVGQSRVRAVLEAGQPVLVVVTGFDGGEGDFTLNMAKSAPPKCPGWTIDAALPTTVTGNTEHLGDAIRPRCGAADSPDASYAFTAPAAGKYVFDTFGSGFNTILELHDGACDGDVLTCSDDSGGGSQSRATVELSAGQKVVAVIDGFEGARGPYTLNVAAWAPPACPMADLGSTYPQTVTGHTSGLDGVLQPACSMSDSPEVSYSFTAPIAGRYTFDTLGSTFNTVLHVHDGSCTGASLGCNDDAEGSYQSQVSTPLAQGQTAVVVVDGASGKHGAYTLNVSGSPAPPCPANALEPVVPQTVRGTTLDRSDFAAAPCGKVGGAEVAYGFTAPSDGLYVFDTFGSSFDTLVHVHAGTCGGEVLGCNDNTTGLQSRVVVPLVAGQETVVVVDGSGPAATGAFTLNIGLFEGDGTCETPIDLGSTVPRTEMGSTLHQPNSGTPSCTMSSGNDRVYRFTAPADGTYVIDTLSSTFDTVLHVHDGDSCAGRELACNDNTNGVTSRVTVPLTAGQVITIIGDSRPSSSGTLTLNIAKLP